eukprot:1068310-Rhodomonas_salina.8
MGGTHGSMSERIDAQMKRSNVNVHAKYQQQEAAPHLIDLAAVVKVLEVAEQDEVPEHLILHSLLEPLRKSHPPFE